MNNLPPRPPAPPAPSMSATEREAKKIIRRQFASAALVGLLAHITRGGTRHDALAREAFEIADAMLEAEKVRR